MSDGSMGESIKTCNATMNDLLRIRTLMVDAHHLVEHHHKSNCMKTLRDQLITKRKNINK